MHDLDELTDQLLCFFNGFASWESSVIRSSDLSVSEAHAIEALGQYGAMNMKNLAARLGVTTGTTTVTVDRLEKKDYARRESVKEDRRVNLITLTEKGKNAFAEHHHMHLNLAGQMAASLSAEEIKEFLLILKKINTDIF